MNAIVIATLAIALAIALLQLIVLAKLASLQEEVKRNANQFSQRQRNSSGRERDPRRRRENNRDGNREGSRDSNREGSRDSNREGSRENSREQEPERERSAPAPRTPVGTIDTSLREINLKLKNAERSQEIARKKIQDDSGENPEGSERSDNGERSENGERSRNRKSRKRRSGSNSNRRPANGFDAAPVIPTDGSDEPQESSRESFSRSSSDDNGRVMLKRRVLEGRDEGAEERNTDSSEERRSVERQEAPVVERTFERTFDRPAERQVEREVERPVERPVERQVERAAERPVVAEREAQESDDAPREISFGRR